MKKIIIIIITILSISQQSYALTYQSQFYTGQYWYNNCLPAALKMTTETTQSVEDIRKFSFNNGNGWTLINAINWLNVNKYDYQLKKLTSETELRDDILKNPKGIIIGANLKYLYPYFKVAGGHAVVLTDSETTKYNWLITVFDPYYGVMKTEKSNVYMAMKKCWEYYIIIK